MSMELKLVRLKLRKFTGSPQISMSQNTAFRKSLNTNQHNLMRTTDSIAHKR